MFLICYTLFVIKRKKFMFDVQPSYNLPTTLFNVLFPIISIVLCAGLFFVLPKKTAKTVKITKLVLGFLLIGLYLAKTSFLIYRYTSLLGKFDLTYVDKMFGLDLNFYFTFMAAFYLIFSAFSNKKNIFLDILKNTIVSISFAYCALALFNPKMVFTLANYAYGWYHFPNILAMVINLILLVTALYLIKANDVQISLKNFWQGLAGYIMALSLCMTLAIVLNVNISELSYSNTLYDVIKTRINFPWFLLIVIPVFLLISFGIYCLIRLIVCKISHTSFIEKPTLEKKNEFFDIYTFATKTVCCMQGILLLIIIATLAKKPQGNVWGLTCLIPFIMTIFCILAVNEMQKYITSNDESIFEDGNKNAKKILTYTFLGNFIFGFAFKAQLKNERENLIEYKKRMERKRQRELEAKEEEIIEENDSNEQIGEENKENK